MTGRFNFLVLKEERYLKMIAGLSCFPSACREMLELLRACWPGYSCQTSAMNECVELRHIKGHRPNRRWPLFINM